VADILFDTSGYRAVPGRRVEALQTAGHRLFLSPMAIWEVLSHLDEPGEWNVVKGMLLKGRRFEFYDDPIAALQAVVGPAPPSDRTPDTVLLPAMLDQLAQAQSLSDFYAMQLLLPNGTVRRLDRCSTEARQELDKRARPFLELVRKVGEHVVEQHGRQPSAGPIGVAALSLAAGEVVKAERRGEVLRIEDAANASLIFWIYVVQQGIRYATSGSGPARNDYEDAQILLHLRLREERIVVSHDRRLSEVLQSVESVLATFDDPDFIKQTTVIRLEILDDALRKLAG
jgi:hypothetical protein